jgi:nitrate reductase NapAB chaperone NapD
MTREYEYKLQGDGRDSWKVTEFDEFDEIISVYMVYEDPTIEVGTALKAVMQATPEEISQIKKLLGV